MGVVDFDPDKWARAHAAEAEAVEPAKVANPAKEGPTLAALAGLAADPQGLAADIVAGLSRLQRMPTPPITLPPVWPEIVSDALRLASEGWAVEAAGEGWEPLDLWGCSPLIGGNEDHLGVAVKLAGRSVLKFKGPACVLRDGPGSYSILYRRPTPRAVFLWDLAGVRG